MQKNVFSKELYLKMAQSEGLAIALKTLHADIWKVEHEMTEGPLGYQPGLAPKLEEMRNFSRELWSVRDQPNA